MEGQRTPPEGLFSIHQVQQVGPKACSCHTWWSICEEKSNKSAEARRMIRWSKIIQKKKLTQLHVTRKTTCSAALDISGPLQQIGGVFISHRYGKGAKHSPRSRQLLSAPQTGTKTFFSTITHSASKSKWIRESSIIAMIFNNRMEINPSNYMKYSLKSDSGWLFSSFFWWKCTMGLSHFTFSREKKGHIHSLGFARKEHLKYKINIMK